MATRAERYKTEAQRRAQQKKRKPRRPAGGRTSDGLDRAALVARHDGAGRQVPHNLAPRAEKDGVYEIEATAGARPSRKSTRRSPSHIKTDSSLRIKAVDRIASPQERATSGKKPAGKGR
ncbi:MAG TPA: hypothetical protein VH374_08975 [Polyangia bacterium]|jgi:hypothetical protein|nr:hypothetical protein [Polyangia bacterium]